MRDGVTMKRRRMRREKALMLMLMAEAAWKV
eukprot:CAMPEP_0204617604 /NCGR_PEP_ID=MMETSP0717-20131115/4531_1 /ASSEMBLY_ACC=CAM_ASM_000666 /TAXON_ID=230516 /ORGANISM="Chaetoceros curvisetus" /LENGTH=30 /DNA_ID= /DNA_START= /DNA_END= /DNA_ORIENTATION=